MVFLVVVSKSRYFYNFLFRCCFLQALGSFYFLHESLKNIYQFDFKGKQRNEMLLIVNWLYVPRQLSCHLLGQRCLAVFSMIGRLLYNACKSIDGRQYFSYLL